MVKGGKPGGCTKGHNNYKSFPMRPNAKYQVDTKTGKTFVMQNSLPNRENSQHPNHPNH